MADLTGRLIGGFRMTREVSKGAQGRVYEAVSDTDAFPNCPKGTEVVLKTMAARDDTGEEFARLSARTDVLAGLGHPNVVGYFGCFKVQEPFAELHVVVMERLDGETLKARLERERTGLDADSAVRIAEGVILGLGAAAAAGVCHRDVKPGNVFLCRDGGVKVIDFEAAKSQGGTVSSSNRLAGSFDYMAPEFADPSFSGDERSDVFSAGVVLHEMLTGLLPYRRSAQGDGGGAQQADFAFLSRWARNADGSPSQRSVVVSQRIRRLLAHSERLFAGSLSVDRGGRFAGFADMLSALREVRFRDLRVEDKAYRILQLVGKGGFGEVFKARLRSTGQVVAIKHLLNSDYADRFYREAKIMAQLDDPCFVRFIDFMVVERVGNRDAFLAMDFLPGMPGNSLKDAIRRSPSGLPRGDVLAAFMRYAHGLRTLHSKGVYHRDIKPANLYYPAGNPGGSAIMDLGIARDVHGTVTTGNVPGTFDYMSPEVVMSESRGGPELDIYALGLCLYEALTGKTAYPRLPRGYAAYAQFFSRAKARERPKFDAPQVAKDPALLALLVAMTEPDVSRRMADAAEVERRLAAIAGISSALPSISAADEDDDTAVAQTVTVTSDNLPGHAPLERRPPPPALPAPVLKRSPRRPSRGAARSAPARPAAGKAVRLAAVVLFLAVLAVAAVAFGPKAVELSRRGASAAVSAVNTYLANRRARIKRISDVAQASSSADLIIGQYAASSSVVDDADALARDWDDRWRETLPEDDFAHLRDGIDAARRARVERDNRKRDAHENEKAMRDGTDEVVGAFAEGDVERGDRLRGEWLAKWKDAAMPEMVALVGRIDKARAAAAEAGRVRDLAKAAATAAEPLARSYETDALEVADKMRSLWESDWRDRLPDAEYAEIAKGISAAREKAVRRSVEKEREARKRALVMECRELCDALEPVEYRSSRLNDAELRMRRAFAGGMVGSAEMDAFLEGLKLRRATMVFRVVNKSDRDISVAGEKLANGAQRVFSFTNGIPAGASISCEGFKPLPITSFMDGRTLNLTPDYLEMERVEVIVPELEEGVSCRIDRVPVKPGRVHVMPGFHEVSYIKDGCETQVIPFRVMLARPMTLSRPGPWRRR